MTAGLVFGSEGLDRGPTCPTASCSWDSYKSVGWCSKCKPINSYLRDPDCTVKSRLDQRAWGQPFCDLWVQSSDRPDQRDNPNIQPLMDLTRLPNADHGVAYELKVLREFIYPTNSIEDFVAADNLVIPHPFLTFRHVIFNHDEDIFQNRTLSDQNPLRLDQFSECILTFCEREYTTKTTNGVTTSNLTSTDYGNFSSQVPTPLKQLPSKWCWRPEGAPGDLQMTSFDEGITYQDESQRAFCPPNALRYADAVSETVAMHHSIFWYFNQTYASKNTTEFFDRTEHLTPAGWSPASISLVFENIAAALTSYGLSTSNLTVPGKAFYRNPTFGFDGSGSLYRPSWNWLALFSSFLQSFTVAALACRYGSPHSWQFAITTSKSCAKRKDSLLSDIDKAYSSTSVQFFRDQDEPGFLLRRVSLKRHED